MLEKYCDACYHWPDAALRYHSDLVADLLRGENALISWSNRKGSQERMSTLRYLEETDFQPIIQVVDEWWGGRSVAVLLQKLISCIFDPRALSWKKMEQSWVFWLVSVLRRRQRRRIFILWERTLNIVAKVLADIYINTSSK